MKLGDKLKEARTKANLKQDELAERIGVSRQTISNWENNRSFPDIGSLLKLSDLYSISLDEMLKQDQGVVQQLEDLAAKRRNFWQMMLEVAIILELLGNFLYTQEFTTVGSIIGYGGIALLYVSLIMHLRVFDHSREELLCGWIALGLQCVFVLLMLWKPEMAKNVWFQFVRMAPPLLLLGAGVWTINWKSTRLWLIIFLIFGLPLFSFSKDMQSQGYLNEKNPFGENYRIAEVLYPEESPVNENVLIKLYGTYGMYIAEDSLNTERIGQFTYVEPIEGQSVKGIWQLLPEEDKQTMYQLTAEADGSIILSCYRAEQLEWKWLLQEDDRDTAFITVTTFGSTMQTRPTWYPSGSPDPEPYFTHTDVVWSATLNLTVLGLETEELTLYEEYHYGNSVEYQTYVLEPEKLGAYKIKLETRYDGEEEYALYRIPFKNGEYRFILTFG